MRLLGLKLGKYKASHFNLTSAPKNRGGQAAHAGGETGQASCYGRACVQTSSHPSQSAAPLTWPAAAQSIALQAHPAPSAEPAKAACCPEGGEPEPPPGPSVSFQPRQKPRPFPALLEGKASCPTGPGEGENRGPCSIVAATEEWRDGPAMECGGHGHMVSGDGWGWGLNPHSGIFSTQPLDTSEGHPNPDYLHMVGVLLDPVTPTWIPRGFRVDGWRLSGGPCVPPAGAQVSSHPGPSPGDGWLSAGTLRGGGGGPRPRHAERSCASPSQEWPPTWGSMSHPVPNVTHTLARHRHAVGGSRP